MKIKMPLWLRLTFMIVLVIFITLFIMSYLHYQNIRDNYLLRFNEKTNLLVNTLSSRYMNIFLYQHLSNKTITYENIKTLIQDEDDIQYIIFKTRTGKLLFYFLKENAVFNNILRIEKPVIISNNNSPVLQENRLVGKIAIGYDNKLPIILNNARLRVIFIGIILIVFGTILAIVTSYLFIRPIYRVIKGMSQVEKGDLNIKLMSKRKDELGKLTDSFNKMVDGLKVKNELIHYVSKGAWDESHKKIRTGENNNIATRKEITVLFADICNFTRLTNSIEPEQLINILNQYFSEMTLIIVNNNGYIDKFIGDAVMSVFEGDHSTMILNAINAGLSMLQKIKSTLYDKHKLQARIGINTGTAIVGDIGSLESRRDYTCIGTTVNIAQRLESICKPGELIISDATYQYVKDAIVTGHTEVAQLKGISDPVKVHSVLDMKL